MESLTLQQIAKAVGSECAQSGQVTNVCIDTRKIRPGDLFLAIPGENFDGHDFIEQAYAAGAVGVISAKPVEGHDGVILVKDTKQALLDLARFYRGLFRLYVVGVTGSVGKTSTKEMIYAILNEKGKTLRTEGNSNNEIGMPLSVLRLDSSYQNAVMEMGMSSFGEIRALSRICMPNVGVITNIGVSHIENLGSRENIMKAKLEIAEYMQPDAPLILNADDDMLCRVNGNIDRPVMEYGITNSAEVTASDIYQQGENTLFTIHYFGKEIRASVPALGIHNVYNALAGFCVGLSANMEPEAIVEGMKQYQNAGLRQRIYRAGGVTIIADCYNASPDSMRSALDVLARVEKTGRAVCVFGDMLELGEISEMAHEEVGRRVARSGVDQLFCYGARAKGIAKGAQSMGLAQVDAFEDKAALAAAIREYIRPGDAIIFKASRGMQLEDVIKLVDEEWNNGLR